MLSLHTHVLFELCTWQSSSRAGRPISRALNFPGGHCCVISCPPILFSAIGSRGGGSGTKPSSTSGAVAAKQAQEAGADTSSTSRTAAAAAAASATDGVKKDAPTRRAKGAATERKKGATLAAGGGDDASDSYAYTESLAFLSSPPEKALKGVGPKRAEQLAKLGKYSWYMTL